MEEVTLEAQLRDQIGKIKTRALRKQGFIPAIIYAERKKSEPLKVKTKDLIKLLHSHRLENTVINLKIQRDGGYDKDRPVLIKEVQYNPTSQDILHIDFNQISLTREITIKVPVVAKGEPIGVKQEGGMLEHILWEIDVQCLPTKIPKDIEVDVSNLKIGDIVHIKDISFPDGIKVLHTPDTIVLSVSSPIKVEEVLQPKPEEEVAEEPEVIKEKKKEEAVEGQAKEEKAEKDEKPTKEAKKEEK